MAGNYDDFPHPAAVQTRLDLLGQLDAALSTHIEEMAVDITPDLDEVRVLSGRVMDGIYVDNRPIGTMTLTLVSIDTAGGPVAQVHLKTPLTRQLEFDLQPDREALGRLTEKDDADDVATRLLLAQTAFTSELSTYALARFKARPNLLGPRLSPFMRAIASGAEEPVLNIPPERPRILSRRRR